MLHSQLFCFPYAGASSVVFNSWKKLLAPDIHLIPVELAGRGRRIHEPFYRNVNEAVDDVHNIVTSHINHLPYAFFGHSMGSMIAYEVAQKLRYSKIAKPRHIFFSGRRAPHIEKPDEKKLHLMNDSDFRREILGLGGTPPEIFEHPELINLFIPLLKNDFRIAETEIRRHEINPFDFKITIFQGTQDDISKEETEGWRLHCNRECNILYFEGGHFFLHDHREELIKIINAALLDTPVLS
jgi:medium-chain acyl-[acyl-carrier-protein] hydrolase